MIRGGCFLFINGEFFHDGSRKQYSSKFFEKDTVIEMVLNMDKSSIHYKIDDKDYGIATDKLSGDKYRLVINLCFTDDCVELL